MDVYLARHPPVDVEEGICYGRTDVDLAAGWQSVAQEMARQLPGSLVEEGAIYASPARRCRLPAAIIAARVVIDERLREFDFGGWEERRWREIPRVEIDAWANDVETYRVPGGDCLRDVYERAISFLEDVRRDHREVAVLTHAGVIRCLLVHATTQRLSDAFRLRVDLRQRAPTAPPGRGVGVGAD